MSTESLQERLEPIKARSDAATPGPWISEMIERHGFFISAADHEETGEYPIADVHAGSSADAEFIAHARTDVPALLALAAAVSDRDVLARLIDPEAMDLIHSQDDDGYWYTRGLRAFAAADRIIEHLSDAMGEGE